MQQTVELFVPRVVWDTAGHAGTRFECIFVTACPAMVYRHQQKTAVPRDIMRRTITISVSDEMHTLIHKGMLSDCVRETREKTLNRRSSHFRLSRMFRGRYSCRPPSRAPGSLEKPWSPGLSNSNQQFNILRTGLRASRLG